MSCKSITTKQKSLFDLPRDIIGYIITKISSPHHLYLFSFANKYCAELCSSPYIKQIHYERFVKKIDVTNEHSYRHIYNELPSGCHDGEELWYDCNRDIILATTQWNFGKKHGIEITTFTDEGLVIFKKKTCNWINGVKDGLEEDIQERTGLLFSKVIREWKDGKLLSTTIYNKDDSINIRYTYTTDAERENVDCTYNSGKQNSFGGKYISFMSQL